MVTNAPSVVPHPGEGGSYRAFSVSPCSRTSADTARFNAAAANGRKVRAPAVRAPFGERQLGAHTD